MKNEKLRENVFLKNHTTFKIGGPARYFFEATTQEEIIEAIKWAKEKAMPFFILGGGSNLLVDDKGFDGLVIKLQTTNYKLQTNNIIYVEAGVKLSELVRISLENGLSGMEWAAGIPGITVGGSVRGNAGAFGQQISDIVKEVVVFDATELKIKKVKLKDCAFDYRESVFKRNQNFVILSALFILKRTNKKVLKKEINFVLNYRRSNHPYEPSAGSIFKNQKLDIKNQKLMLKFPETKKFKSKGKIPAVYFIEQCGLKGKTIGIIGFGNIGKETAKRALAFEMKVLAFTPKS